MLTLFTFVFFIKFIALDNEWFEVGCTLVCINNDNFHLNDWQSG